jgi:hypothetical protein
MRPTPDKERLKAEDENGTSLVIDPGLKNKLLSPNEAEVWIEFAVASIKALAGNADLTTNNAPTTITDEACLMADRMLLGYRLRLNKYEAKNGKPGKK